MKQPITTNFHSYVRYLLSKSSISTRELNRRINKSSAYLSKLLAGQIKSIEYDTAYNIFKNLVPDMTDIDTFLTEQFDIKPDSLIQQEMEDDIRSDEHMTELFKEGQELVDELGRKLMDDLFKCGDFEKIEIIRKIIELDFSSSSIADGGIIADGEIIKMILNIKNPKEHRLLSLFMDELIKVTSDDIFGECDIYPQLNDEDKNIVEKIHKILKEELDK
jgi:transcriptional regulator with XRE-family HTH domain